jgi:uncharacterized glyoxalase superfamily protein PhnB
MPLQFEINVFKNLIEKYPSWEELQRFLESDEGGLFRVADRSEDGFCLIRYEKGTSKMDLPHSKWFRSVVWNTKTNRPVCMAPPKASSQDFTFNTLKDISDAGIVCQELLEGFMINCFRVAGSETLHITSRSKLNAAGKFYSEKSFRELFMEAYMNTTDCPHYSEQVIQDNSQHLVHPDSSKNEVATFYSFLVQHKEHRIVKLNGKNRVYLIHSGVVYDDGRVEVLDSPEKVKEQPNIQNIPLEQAQTKGSYAKIAAQANELSDETTEVQKWIKKHMLDMDWTFQGLVFKDKEGNRWRFRSEKYAAVKTLRGNSPTISERFAQLYTQNLIPKYLEYYSEDMMPIAVHMMFMDTVVKILYDNYVDLHITKTKKVDEIDKMFHPHLYSIHGIYLTQLQPAGKKINFDEIKIYLHKQPWQRIAFLIKKIVQKANNES